MDKLTFFVNLIEFSRDEGFTFLVPGEGFADQRGIAPGNQAILSLMAGSVAGLLGSLSCGFRDQIDRNTLESDLRSMAEYCDVVGINVNHGTVYLRLGVDCDNLSGETLIGRLALIHDRAFDFRKYATSFMRSVFSDGKLATYCQPVLVFSEHTRPRSSRTIT